MTHGDHHVSYGRFGERGLGSEAGVPRTVWAANPSVPLSSSSKNPLRANHSMRASRTIGLWPQRLALAAFSRAKRTGLGQEDLRLHSQTESHDLQCGGRAIYQVWQISQTSACPVFTTGAPLMSRMSLTRTLRCGGSSFEKFQELFFSQLSLLYYVHERGLVNLFVERYDCASTISMSQENMTAPLPYESEAYFGQGPNDFFSR